MKRIITLDEEQKLHETKDGFVIYKSDEDFCDICLIEIDCAEKNRGFGSKLLQSFIEAKKADGIKEFYLDAWVTSNGIFSIEVLVKFYSKFGFKETERMDEEAGQTRVFMCLNMSEKSVA